MTSVMVRPIHCDRSGKTISVQVTDMPPLTTQAAQAFLPSRRYGGTTETRSSHPARSLVVPSSSALIYPRIRCLPTLQGLLRQSAMRYCRNLLYILGLTISDINAMTWRPDL